MGEIKPYDVNKLDEIVIFKGTNGQVVEISRDGKYINLIKQGEEDKRYFRYNLQTEEFERINFYKTVADKITPVNVENITYWFSGVRLITKDVHFGRLIVFAKNSSTFNRYKSPVRFVQQLGHPEIKCLEQWEALGIRFKEVEDYFGERMVRNYYSGVQDYRKDIYLDEYTHAHNISITKSPAQCIKEVINHLKECQTVSVSYFNEIVDYYNNGEFAIHDALVKMEKKPEFQGIFSYYDNSWSRECYVNVFDDCDSYKSLTIKHRIFNVIKDYSLELEAFCRWIKKQQNIDKNDLDYLFNSNHYPDYLRCEYELKQGYRSKMNKYPDNFRTEFHKAEVEFEAERGKVDEFKFSLQQEHYRDLEHVGRKFCMIIPKHPNEIKNEANCLHHCVRTYIKPMTEGETLIMFLRDKNEPDVPLITVEVKNGVIRQAYGDHDSKPLKEHLDFLRMWAKNKKLEMACWR